MTVALKKLTPNLMVEHVNDTVAFLSPITQGKHSRCALRSSAICADLSPSSNKR